MVAIQLQEVSVHIAELLQEVFLVHELLKRAVWAVEQILDVL
jgi:hypothetical protein